MASRLPFWESRRVQVRGKIVEPKIKATAASVNLNPSDGLVLRDIKSTMEGKPIGYISYRASVYSANLYMPSDAFGLVLQAFTANKYHWLTMEGTKSGNGEVMVLNFLLLEEMADDDD